VASECKGETVESPVSRGVLERVRRTSAGILATDVASDERFVESETLFEYSVRSFMCAPLNTRESTVGAVYVESRTHPGCFTESDLELLTVFGNQIATALENASLYEELERSFYETVRSLLAALEAKDEYTRGHSDRVALYAVGIAEALNLPKERLNDLKTAAELHDIGKIAVPESIINSPSRLSDEEFECIKKHPEYGVQILRPIRFLSAALPIVRHHHERYDGTGYPEGLIGESIPLEARILNLADAFDAMTSTRSYNKPVTLPDALARCREEAGVSFDPRCVAALGEFVENRFSTGSSGSTAPSDASKPGKKELNPNDTGAFDQQAVLKEISELAAQTTPGVREFCLDCLASPA
jgi:putative nucleotidyltransferase with HDIG domain